ncbi:MAG: PIN domain-containing protein [Pseudonocardiaceae bacterium]|nr:PIN domain-containing protein [Pseudonocardiaceae bacterium]
MIADTSGLLASFNVREPQHERVRRCLDATAEALVVSPYVLAELDDLIGTRVGVAAELAALRELTRAAYELAAIGAEDLAAAADIVERYHESTIGLTDASLVVLADRYHTHRVLTLDHRHFRALRALDGRPFELLP